MNKNLIMGIWFLLCLPAILWATKGLPYVMEGHLSHGQILLVSLVATLVLGPPLAWFKNLPISSAETLWEEKRAKAETALAVLSNEFDQDEAGYGLFVFLPAKDQAEVESGDRTMLCSCTLTTQEVMQISGTLLDLYEPEDAEEILRVLMEEREEEASA